MERAYTHTPLNEQVHSIGGYYSVHKETRLPFKGRQVLYLVGVGVLDSSCCGEATIPYAMVAGYVIQWQASRSEQGHPVSMVELISDIADRRELSSTIRNAEQVRQVEFW